MLAASLLSAAGRLASRGLAQPANRLQQVLAAASPANLIQCQQVRFARKTFGLRYRYGLQPLYTDHMYQRVVEQDQLEDLVYQQIRFAMLWETNSPLQDDTLEKYLRFMMRDGRRHLMYELLHNTLYEIKLIQYKRWRKLQERRQKQEPDESKKSASKKATATATTTTTTTTTTVEDDEQNQQVELNPIVLFHQALDNCKPAVVTTKIKRGGAVYQVPSPISANNSEYLAMKWLNDMVKERPKPRKRHYHEELAQEILDAAANRGKVVKKKDDIHKLAQANKAYAHYRWS